MDLIEHFGSYEKAKAFLNAASYTIDELIMMQRSGLRPQHVEKALLEYRRQHNIFEVGDKICFDATFCDSSENMGFGEITYISRDSRVFEIEGEYLVSLGEIRHATDEEIKAGHRLPEKDKDV